MDPDLDIAVFQDQRQWGASLMVESRQEIENKQEQRNRKHHIAVAMVGHRHERTRG
jgi:hypothetical protein